LVSFKFGTDRFQRYAHKRPPGLVLSVSRVVSIDDPEPVQERVNITHEDRFQLWRINNKGARVTARSNVPLTDPGPLLMAGMNAGPVGKPDLTGGETVRTKLC
jgi:hypothetical protein